MSFHDASEAQAASTAARMALRIPPTPCGIPGTKAASSPRARSHSLTAGHHTTSAPSDSSQPFAERAPAVKSSSDRPTSSPTTRAAPATVLDPGAPPQVVALVPVALAGDASKAAALQHAIVNVTASTASSACASAGFDWAAAAAARCPITVGLMGGSRGRDSRAAAATRAAAAADSGRSASKGPHACSHHRPSASVVGSPSAPAQLAFSAATNAGEFTRIRLAPGPEGQCGLSGTHSLRRSGPVRSRAPTAQAAAASLASPSGPSLPPGQLQHAHAPTSAALWLSISTRRPRAQDAQDPRAAARALSGASCCSTPARSEAESALHRMRAAPASLATAAATVASGRAGIWAPSLVAAVRATMSSTCLHSSTLMAPRDAEAVLDSTRTASHALSHAATGGSSAAAAIAARARCWGRCLTHGQTSRFAALRRASLPDGVRARLTAGSPISSSGHKHPCRSPSALAAPLAHPKRRLAAACHAARAASSGDTETHI
mmetsp:Transcript_5192/g.22108  ORF Transcript_5192/g.22108 Transcript_5192/m.22108 type:complete len:492 (-) Transcript_5192:973-2448(-)